MKKKILTKTIAPYGLFFIFLSAIVTCTPKIKTSEALPVGDNSMVSLDWNGTYTGTIPCADCVGIETWLSLNIDKTYLLKTKYLGKNDSFQEKSGIFTWNTAGSTVILKGISSTPNQYLVGENILFQLDMSGKKITGNLADKYQLKKVQ